jgi:hypothetical protein
MTLSDAARKFLDAFKEDPGHSDLDNEQPIHITVTLGDLRRLRHALREPDGFRWRPDTWQPLESEPVSCVVAFISDEDEEIEAILSGLFLWREGRFVEESTGFAPKAPFFWCYERELTASVPLPQECVSGDGGRP